MGGWAVYSRLPTGDVGVTRSNQKIIRRFLLPYHVARLSHLVSVACKLASSMMEDCQWCALHPP